MARKVDWRRVKIHRPYTVEELASALSVSAPTIRRWQAHGLRAIDDGHPTMFKGDIVRTFLKERMAKAEYQRCGPDEFLCLRCRAPRRPDGLLADYVPKSAVFGMLHALCEACGGVMTRPCNAAKLTDLATTFDLSVRQGDQDLTDIVRTCLKDHLEA